MSLTKEQVLKMDWKAIQVAVKDPSTKAEMQNLLRDRQVVSYVSKLMLEAQEHEASVDAQLSVTVPPSTEQLAAEAAAMVEEVPAVVTVEVPVVTAPVVASFEADDAAWKAAGVTVVRDANGKAVRYIEEYQVSQEDGTTIGRPTHLEASTLQELTAKKREVHTQATRAFHRLKQQKLTFKNERTILSPEAIAEAARQALESKDSTKITDVIEEVIESKYKTRENELRNREAFESGRAISNEFRSRHLHDYNPCEANQKAINEYFTQHKLEFTLDNLEVAFQDLLEQGDKIAKVENLATRQAAAVANPPSVAAVVTPAPPAIPVAETPAAVTAQVAVAQPVPSQPVVEATVTMPAAAPNVQPAARRPGVNGGLPPGSLSAQRPGTPDPALARKEFLLTVKNMKPEIMKNKLKTDPQFVKQLESYGIRVR